MRLQANGHWSYIFCVSCGEGLRVKPYDGQPCSRKRCMGARAKKTTEAAVATPASPQMNHEFLKQISPRESDMYSENLHRWLWREVRTKMDVRIYREEESGQLHVGWMFDGDFLGSKLWRVLCDGNRAQRYSYGPGFKEVEGFWDRYLALGKCAIDVEHKHYSERWRGDEEARECMWCGHKQVRERWKVVVEKERWVSP